MEQWDVRALLDAVARGEVTPEQAEARLRVQPFVDLGYAKLDTQRKSRPVSYTHLFHIAELRARVAAHLRRQQRTPRTRMRRSGLDFDLSQKALFYDGAPLKLTRGEYAICEHLALHAGQTFSKEQIYEAVFGYDADGTEAAVTLSLIHI